MTPTTQLLDGIAPVEASAARVLIVDDHILLAQGLSVTLRLRGIAAAVCPSPAEADVAAMVADFQPDVVLLDFSLGEGLGTGADLISTVRAACPASRILMLTGITDRLTLAGCLEAGADGLLAKSAGFDELLQTVVRAAEGGSVIDWRERAEMLAEARRHAAARRERLRCFSHLTPREQQVLAGLIDGRTAQEIADEAYVGLGTVRTQIKAVREKLGVSSQLAAVALARREQWTPGTG